MKPIKVYLVTLAIFILFTVFVLLSLFDTVYNAFLANVYINSFIIFTFILSLIYFFISLLKVAGDNYAISMHYDSNINNANYQYERPFYLKNLIKLINFYQKNGSGSKEKNIEILNELYWEMNEIRSVLRYFIGLLIFLGLLGTFWGLLKTVGSVGEVIASLQVDNISAGNFFEDLKQGLSDPLNGMGIAFSSSLFGLAGSLIVGFLELVSTKIQNRFVANCDFLLGIFSSKDSLSGSSDQNHEVLLKIEKHLDALSAFTKKNKK